MKHIITVIFAAIVVISISSGTVFAKIEGLNVQPDPDNPDRLLVHADALIRDVPGQIDRRVVDALPQSCSRRLHWHHTSIRSGGEHLELKSRMRYEQWLCLILKTRLVQSTHDIWWRLDVNEGAQLDDLFATATVTNIKEFPDELEELFGLRGTVKSVRIPIPTHCGKCACADLVNALRPMAEKFRFLPQNNGRDVLIKAMFSAPRDLSPIARCF